MSEQISGDVLSQSSAGENSIPEIVNTNDNNIQKDVSKVTVEPKAIAEPSKEPVVKQFTQEHIDSIVQKAKDQAKRQGYEAAKNELLAKINPQTEPVNNNAQINPEFQKGYVTAYEELQKKQDIMAAQDFVGRLKIDPGTKAADEATAFFNEFDKTSMPLVYQLNSLGNTADVYDYLKSNPNVKQEIKNLIQVDAMAVLNGMRSTLSYSKLQEISERIRQNAQSASVKANNPSPPKGNDIKPSKITLGEYSTPKVSDIMKNMKKY